jgi:hypothetical protein
MKKILKSQVKARKSVGRSVQPLPPAPSVAFSAPVRGLVRGRPWAGPCVSVGQPATVCRPRGLRNPALTDV